MLKLINDADWNQILYLYLYLSPPVLILIEISSITGAYQERKWIKPSAQDSNRSFLVVHPHVGAGPCAGIEIGTRN